MRKQRQIIYLGWQGFDNFGDDLMHRTWQAALADPLVVAVPAGRRGFIAAAPRFAAHWARRPRTENVLLLGGGTTIGFADWARRTRLAMACFGSQALVIAGAGAAASHDRFALSLQAADWAAWRGMRDVALLGVRGPITQEECARHWRKTDVIGDPALLYPVYAPWRPAPVPRTALGVCLGASPTSRFDIPTVAQAVTAYRARHPDQAVRVLQLCDSDAPVARALASRLEAPVIAYDGNVPATMRAIAECSLLVSERLHGVVAAAACGVPPLPLAYATKCDDFWLSTTGHLPTLRPEATVDQILEGMEKATDPLHAEAVSREVCTLQEKFKSAVDLLRQWQEHRIDTQELVRRQ
ncbi:polysaccharide pyruvyl transferase family protein [Streptomyces sp. NPDC050287]|uniref:polysaccharide pyruvyl transferase family protein n=1 Tax=Streptomyces sp. NPDC050287 TaxID=3365608 RepID=UPI0037956999